jgi:hypothetical protein
MRKGKLSNKLRQFIALIVVEAVVFGLGYWVVFRFFPANEAINNAIVTLFIFAVGITIIIYGNVTKNRNLNGLGFGIFLFAVFVVIDKYEGFAVKISAFATLAVAIAAFASIEENRRVRKDSIERESRDRKERLIDEVAKWLRELEGSIFAKYAEIASGTEDIIRRMRSNPKIPQETWVQLRAIDRALVEMGSLAGGIKEAEYYQKLTLKLDEDLSRLIGVIANDMEQRRQLDIEDARYTDDLSWKAEKSQLINELLEHDDRPLEGLGLSAKDISGVRLGRNAGVIRKSIRNALDRVIELKASFIQVS